jgi:hypothetical protein
MTMKSKQTVDEKYIASTLGSAKVPAMDCKNVKKTFTKLMKYNN